MVCLPPKISLTEIHTTVTSNLSYATPPPPWQELDDDDDDQTLIATSPNIILHTHPHRFNFTITNVNPSHNITTIDAILAANGVTFLSNAFFPIRHDDFLRVWVMVASEGWFFFVRDPTKEKVMVGDKIGFTLRLFGAIDGVVEREESYRVDLMSEFLLRNWWLLWKGIGI